MKQTAVQQLIEWLNDYPTEVPVIRKSAVLAKLESMLEKERAQIERAYDVSLFYALQFVEDWELLDGDVKSMSKEYYNQTFNSEAE